MLKIKKILKEDVTFNLKTDFYIPIKVEFPSNDISTENLYYYRIFDDKSSFIEVGVNSKSHKIYSITAVSINGMNNPNEVKTNFENLKILKGNPIIDTNIWNNAHIVDINHNFLVTFFNDKLFIIFNDGESAVQRLILPHIELLIDKNECTVGFIFYDIPSENKKDFEDGLSAYLRDIYV